MSTNTEQTEQERIDELEERAVAALGATLAAELEQLAIGSCLVFDADGACEDNDGYRVEATDDTYLVARRADGSLDYGRDREDGNRWITDVEHLARVVLRWWTDGVGLEQACAEAIAGDDSCLSTITVLP